MHFDRFSAADRIVVTIQSEAVGEPITDGAKIQALRVFVLSHSDGWSVPLAGPPIARLSARFYQGDRFLGDFGAGEGFAAAQGCGYFQTRKLPSEDSADFARLLGVGETEVRWK